MTILKWDPYKNLKQIQESVDSLFEPAIVNSKYTEEDSLKSEWIPDVDIYEDDGKLVIKVDMPEVSESDISIKFDNSILILKGERKFSAESSIENYRRIERPYGTFSRKFAVPSNVDTNAIKAKLADGILRITLPKRAEDQP